MSKLFSLKIILTFCFLINFSACGISRIKIEIQDFVILPYGYLYANQISVNAFIFENDLNILPIQEFLSKKFKTKSLLSNEIDFIIDKQHLTLLVYDTDDFEKYFGTNNFVAKNQENNAQKAGNANKFIAMSVVSDQNQDCLDNNNLLFNKTVEYLKNLKSNYLLENGKQ